MKLLALIKRQESRSAISAKTSILKNNKEILLRNVKLLLFKTFSESKVYPFTDNHPTHPLKKSKTGILPDNIR